MSVSYGSYLKIRELLGLQQPLSRPAHHDEMLFIIIHQVYELWFKQLLHEVDAASAALDDGDLLRVSKHFKRCTPSNDCSSSRSTFSKTMTPHDFNQFRDNLNPASGFQSVQFRELEFACGVRRTEVLAVGGARRRAARAFGAPARSAIALRPPQGVIAQARFCR